MSELADRTLDTLLAEDPGGPVVMLNPLRFRPDGGRESYQRYVDAVGGVLALVRYPSRATFVAMVRDPDYEATAHLRSEALVAAVLQPTVPLLEEAA